MLGDAEREGSDGIEERSYGHCMHSCCDNATFYLWILDPWMWSQEILRNFWASAQWVRQPRTNYQRLQESLVSNHHWKYRIRLTTHWDAKISHLWHW